jgi:hypothetical protein
MITIEGFDGSKGRPHSSLQSLSIVKEEVHGVGNRFADLHHLLNLQDRGH